MIINRKFVQTWEILIFSCIPQPESKRISHFTTFWNPKAKLILIIWQPMGLWYLSPWSIINKLFNVNKDIYYNIQTLIFYRAGGSSSSHTTRGCLYAVKCCFCRLSFRETTTSGVPHSSGVLQRVAESSVARIKEEEAAELHNRWENLQ